MARTAKKNGNGRNNGHVFKGYTFYKVVNQDPVCYKVKTLVQDEGMYHDRRRLSLLTGLSVSTVDNLLDGVTRLPRHTTIGAFVNSLGFKEVFVRDHDKSIDRDKAIEKAQKQQAAKREELRRQAERTAARK